MVCQMMDVLGFQVAVGMNSVLGELCVNVAIVRTLRAHRLFQGKKSYVDIGGFPDALQYFRVVKHRPS